VERRRVAAGDLERPMSNGCEVFCPAEDRAFEREPAIQVLESPVILAWSVRVVTLSNAPSKAHLSTGRPAARGQPSATPSHVRSSGIQPELVGEGAELRFASREVLERGRYWR
jgi:hypothetical protein